MKSQKLIKRKKIKNKENMEINIGPRRSGKTTRLINWLKEDINRVCIFSSREEVLNLQKLYPQIADKFFYWADYRSKCVNTNAEIGIDNADCVLRELFGKHITKIEFNQELIKSIKCEIRN